jgi:hypothetical protein
LERWGATVQAETLRHAADELEEAEHVHALELLSLGDSADESGYSISALEKMMARGDVPNAGRKGAPRIRRCDLPRKPGSDIPTDTDGPDVVTDMLARRVAGG